MRSQGVNVYGLRLDVPDDAFARLKSWLDAEETARAERFVFEIHRRRFAAARGALRGVLGQELGLAPARLRFGYGPRGKPRLAEPLQHELHFNVSHSRDRAFIALTLGREVGVDLEAVRESVDHAAIARRFFAPREVEAWLALPEAARAAAFFEIWVRKEAYLKLNGAGLGIPLDSFDVGLGEPPRLLRDARDPGAPDRVTLATPTTPPGFKAAVAVDGPADLRTIELDGAQIQESAAPVL